MNYATATSGSITKQSTCFELPGKVLELIRSSRKTRHTFPLDPQPVIQGVSKYWKDSYYATGVLEMFSIILLQLEIKPGAFIAFKSSDNENDSIVARILNAKIDKLQLIEAPEAIAEGVEKLGVDVWRDYTIQKQDALTREPLRNSHINTPQLSFLTHWIKEHGVNSFHTNPYVVSFNFTIHD